MTDYEFISARQYALHQAIEVSAKGTRPEHIVATATKFEEFILRDFYQTPPPKGDANE